MIVDSMTHAEVYEELSRDRDAVSQWWQHTLSAQRRRVLKSTKFPLTLWFEHTTPRRIHYLIFTHIFDKRMKNIMTGLVVPRRTPDGWTTYTSCLSHQYMTTKMVLIPHVWKRYAERCGVEKTGIELIKHYYERNYSSRDSDNEKLVGRSVRWNGEEHRSCCVNDGVILGQLVDGIYIARTFITYNMTCGRQKVEFNGNRKRILNSRDIHDKLAFYYQTGIGF